jgi:hypothetical protein
MALPTAPLVNELHPDRLRAIITGNPGAGKTTLAAGWYPQTNLLIDLEGGTRFLSGEHFVVRPKNYSEFMATVNELVTTNHQFTSVTIDTVDHLVRMADAEAGQRSGKVAAGLVEYGKGLADRDGTVMRDITRLLSTDLGVLLLAHSTRVEVQNDDGTTSERWFPRIDPGDRLRQPIIALVDFLLVVRKHPDETRDLLTGGSGTYETKRRVELPNTLPADAGALYGAVKASIDQLSPVAVAA